MKRGMISAPQPEAVDAAADSHGCRLDAGLFLLASYGIKEQNSVLYDGIR